MTNSATPAPTVAPPWTKVPTTRGGGHNINDPNFEPPTLPTPTPRDAANMPCGPSQCKDVVTGECRSFNPRREKINETDQWERPSGGGRGYCRQLDNAGAGAGAGAGRGAGRGAGAPGPPTGPGSSSDFDSMIQDYLRQMLAGPSRYTPEAMQALYGQTTAQASGQIARGERAVRAEAAGRNMSRAGSVAAGIRSVRSTAEGQRGAANVGIMQAKINADYQDKTGALDRAQRYLDSLRDSEYRYTLLAEQRRQFDANLALAYANIQSQWDMLRAQMGFALVSQGA